MLGRFLFGVILKIVLVGVWMVLVLEIVSGILCSWFLGFLELINKLISVILLFESVVMRCCFFFVKFEWVCKN